MCYHKASPQKIDLKEYLGQFHPGQHFEVPDFQAFYHVSGFDHPRMPVRTAEHPDRIQTFIWGLIPPWTKTREDAVRNARLFLNTTSEKATTLYKPLFQQRCLIYVTGFFEWKWDNPLAKTSRKTPWFIHRHHQVFTLGGYYHSWTDKESGEIFDTYSVITTPANELMSEIHNNKKRMPLIIGASNHDVWLDAEAPPEVIYSLMKPYDEDQLDAHEVSKSITRRGFDTNVPEIQLPVSGFLF